MKTIFSNCDWKTLILENYLEKFDLEDEQEEQDLEKANLYMNTRAVKSRI